MHCTIARQICITSSKRCMMACECRVLCCSFAFNGTVRAGTSRHPTQTTFRRSGLFCVCRRNTLLNTSVSTTLQGLASHQFVFCSAMYDISRYAPSQIKIGSPPPALVSPALRPDLDIKTYYEFITLTPDLRFRTLRGRECSQRHLAAFIKKELNVLWSVGGVSFGRDADPLFSLLQAVDMLQNRERASFRAKKGL